MALLPVADALAQVIDGATPVATEQVPLTEAEGRVLAADLAARRTQPPQDVSAMDGYAVRATDVATAPVHLRVIGEVAAGRPTAAVFAGEDRAAVERCARAVATPAYRVQRGRDPVGVEAAAATKNVYAIAVGLCHGLGEAGGQPWHDLAAATFTQAVAEMGRLAVALGGRQETVLGLAGLGDLEVTSLSGRNRVLGARVGRGEPPAEALAAMAAAGQTVEGVPAARLARDLAAQLARERPDEAGDLPARLPLLAAVNRLLDGDPHPAALVAAAVLPS